MILYGPAIEPNGEYSTNRAVQLGELIVFNSIQHPWRNEVNPDVHRHTKNRETLAPIYLALKCHVERRKHDLVDKLSTMGLSISYDRLLDISSDVAHAVCSGYQSEGVVCPPKLVKNIFTTEAVNNIDHNPSSTPSASFHETAISMGKHPKIEDDVSLDTIPIIDAKAQGKHSIIVRVMS